MLERHVTLRDGTRVLIRPLKVADAAHARRRAPARRRQCAELGFHTIDDPSERGVKVVTLPLDEVPAEALH